MLEPVGYQLAFGACVISVCLVRTYSSFCRLYFDISVAEISFSPDSYSCNEMMCGA